jgi:hypothetical protein
MHPFEVFTSAQHEDDAHLYREIPTSLVRTGRAYDFDLFLRMHDGHRLFAARGVVLTRDHLSLMSREDMRFAVRSQEWPAARETLMRDSRPTFAAPALSPGARADLICSSAIRSLRDTYRGAVPRTIADVERYAGDQVKRIIRTGHVLDHLGHLRATDHFTFQHSVRVGILATALLGKIFGDRLSRDHMVRLCTGFFLHDIGMSDVPMEIIEKPGHLSDREKGVVRMHPLWGQERILNERHLGEEAVAIILSHHERTDGSGYPFHKRGGEIPVIARICTVADTFEALTAERPYHRPLSPFEALQTMHRDLSGVIDPGLFAAFVRLLGPQ